MIKNTLAQQTAEHLRDMIIKEQIFRYGDKLPNENDLSNRLGISRTTLREAIHILTSEGLLTVKRGKGTFVSAQINQYVSGKLELKDLADMKITLRDLYEARMIFEPEAAALACKRATEEEIQQILELGQICQEQLRLNPTGKQRIESENMFHGAIVKASHNDFLSRFMPLLTETIERTFSFNFNYEVIAEDAYKDHILIMEFLQKRDAEAVRSAVTIHLHHAIWNEELPERNENNH
ncbi:MAG: FadR/GntR family transcriptional regulator [Eubacteriales bacterium]|nr:FadR/GntR family transcriptional regulator [Eubacteriales bacterium]